MILCVPCPKGKYLKRSLIEQRTALFSLQSVVMKYMTDRLIEQVYHKITTGDIRLLISYLLVPGHNGSV
ncbi:hypothetical protein FD724_23655 [Nostoc sp. C057]|uniref:hypothetical protein n=1 Tax=Nostoc sp. C057 TaxID=2576903 RepID=UPI0015C40668|nr:hypothetical protein [Nostoc sp. C057]QLE50795.1 hypothetical protein FD724_23655 [Nostoc sp. C057]